MANKPLDIERLKKIIKQISGKVKPNDGELITPRLIKGRGHIWCYSPQSKDLKRVCRGAKVYIIDEQQDQEGRVMIYTESAEVVLIEQTELLMIGFN